MNKKLFEFEHSNCPHCRRECHNTGKVVKSLGWHVAVEMAGVDVWVACRCCNTTVDLVVPVLLHWAHHSCQLTV